MPTEVEKLLKLWDLTGEPIILSAPAHARGMNIRIDKLKTCREKAEDRIGIPSSCCEDTGADQFTVKSVELETF